MALGANIDSVVLLYSEVDTLRDQIRTGENAIQTKEDQIQQLHETMIAEIEDANTNGIGAISAGFIPAVTGFYTLRKDTRVVRIYWDQENQKVRNVRVLRPNEVSDEVASL